MVIDTTRTKVERQIAEQQLFSTGRWFITRNGIIFGSQMSTDIYISNKMGESDDN